MDDLISRQAAIETVRKCNVKEVTPSYMLIDKAEAMTELMMLPSAQPEQPPEIQDILNYLDTVLHPIISPEHWGVYSDLHDMISSLPSVQPEPDINDVTCDNCDYSEKFVDGLILCRRTKISHRVSATSTCGKGKHNDRK